MYNQVSWCFKTTGGDHSICMYCTLWLKLTLIQLVITVEHFNVWILDKGSRSLMDSNRAGHTGTSKIAGQRVDKIWNENVFGCWIVSILPSILTVLSLFFDLTFIRSRFSNSTIFKILFNSRLIIIIKILKIFRIFFKMRHSNLTLVTNILYKA